MKPKKLKSTAPPTSLLSPRFVYVPAASTDIRATFARLGLQPPAPPAKVKQS